MKLRKYFTRPVTPMASGLPREDGTVDEPRAKTVTVSSSASSGEPDHGHFPYHKVHFFGRPSRKGVRRAAPVVLALLCTGVTLAMLGAGLTGAWGRSKSENHLQTAQLSSKVKATSAKAPEEPPPLPPLHLQAPKLEENREVPPVPAQAPLPVLRETSEIVIPPPPIEKVVSPVEPPPVERPPFQAATPSVAVSPVRTVHPVWHPYLVLASTYGETPMLRNWRMLKWASALAVAVTLTPVSFAQEDTKAILDSVNKLKDELKTMKKDLKDDFAVVTQQFEKLAQDIVNLQKDSITQRTEWNKLNTRLEGLESQLSKLRSELEALRADKTNGTRIAKAAPVGARILLLNLYSEELLFVINGRTYRVAPNTQTPLEGQTPGALTYEVISPTFGRRAFNTTTLNPNETFTLTAR